MNEVAQENLEHLKLLSIFHYVVAALAVIFASIFIIHLILGIVALVSPESLKDEAGRIPPPVFGWIFTILGSSIVLGGWIYAICLVFAGRFLARKKHRLYCLVMAAVSCIFFPFGTVLGVFTIIILMRPAVKELFALSTS
ncbi:MAG: hypothetical protein V1727_00895 [Candidatus Omnitrophota bacterium]